MRIVAKWAEDLLGLVLIQHNYVTCDFPTTYLCVAL